MSLVLLAVAIPSATHRAAAQTASSSTPSNSSSLPNASAATVVRTVQGRVVNALDGSPVPRVLVNLNAREVLTDAQGRFSFPEFSDTQAYVLLTRPGFSQTPSVTMMGRQQHRITNLDAPLEFKIYPDAIITGVVSTRDGLPLSRIQVQLRRAIVGPQGSSVQMVAAAVTDTRGQYRFRQPPGDYQLGIQYIARAAETGEAILPEQFPEHNATDTPAFFSVASGEQRQVDLRPRSGETFPVQIRVDVPEAERGIMFSVTTAGGESFNSGGWQSQQGLFQMMLPAGNYLLNARVNGKDTALTGMAKLTVTGRMSEPVVLHLAPMASIPIELSVDSASTGTSSFAAPASTSTGSTSSTTAQATAPPDIRQLNLRLVSLNSEGPNGQNEQVQLQQRADKTYEFRVAPGRYRLEANNGGRWYVESASYGVDSLMSGEIAIASGGSTAAIRLVVNNIKGTVQATVAVPPGSGGAFVYLVPRAPSIDPIFPSIAADNGTGTAITSVSLPVGSYLALALEDMIGEDLRNPDVIAKLSTQAKQVDVTASATTTVALEIAQQPKETPP